MRSIRLLPLLLWFGLSSLGLAALAPPAPDDPLILHLVPPLAQQGQLVIIRGFNFGGAPQVTFNGTPAAVILRNRSDLRMDCFISFSTSSSTTSSSNTNGAHVYPFQCS